MSMKKNIKNSLLLVITALCFVSCASSKKNALPPGFEDDLYSADSNSRKIKAPDFNTDWVRKKSKNVDALFGNVKLRAKKSTGAFNICVVNDDGKVIPVFSTADEYNSTSFYLKAGNKIIKLNQDSIVSSAAHKTNDGMQVYYKIDDVATVVVDFTCFKSDAKNRDTDSIRVTARVLNTGKKKNEFQLKVVLDTILGETDRHHFYTSSNTPVKNEVALRKFTEDDWFISKNNNASMQFLFKGLEATETDLVAIANYSTLVNATWEPDMLSYRTFDTILSYNNSAVGAIWTPKKLSIDESFDEVFYISLAAGSDSPSGNVFVCGDEPVVTAPVVKPADKKPVVEEKTPEKKPEDKVEPKVEPKEETKVEPKEEPKVEEKTAEKPEENKTPEVKEEKTEPEKPVEEKTDNQNKKDPVPSNKYSDDYVRRLIDRIKALQNENDPISQKELIELNMELDAILESLRK